MLSLDPTDKLASVILLSATVSSANLVILHEQACWVEVVNGSSWLLW